MRVAAEVHPSSSGSPEASPAAHSTEREKGSPEASPARTTEREKGKLLFSVEASGGLQPVNEGGVMTLPFEPEKEFHLEVAIPEDDLEITYI